MAIDRLSAVVGPGVSPRPFSEVMPRAVRTPVAPSPLAAPVQPPQTARIVGQGIDRLRDAQHRLDSILRLAQSGRSFTPAELLALQAQVYQASNQIDLAGKVVDKATAGVKQILQTQV